MTANEPNNTPTPKKMGKTTLRRRKHVAEKRATAQRTKLDAQVQARAQQAAEKAAEAATSKPKGRHEQQRLQASRRAGTTIARAVDDYLQDHAGGNHSDKTLEWHRTALGLMRTYFEKERGISLVGEVDAPDISAWFASMRKTPTGRGRFRSERTIQTYARSVRAFCHWLVRREVLEHNPFDRVVFPKVGKSLIRTISLWELRPGRPRHGWRRRWPGMSSRRCGAIPSSAPSCPRSRPLLLLSHTVLEQYRPST